MDQYEGWCEIMASSKEYLHFILEQLSDLDDISYRFMMGEYILYYRGKMVGGFYDDRLLVKIISHDRTFAGAVRKSERALQEMRIRGVKTNIPFLINVLNHPTFQSGQCYTTFIEETPELFRLTHSLNRATKII